MENQTSERGIWSSKLGFILAAAGSAIGLGNIWRFPYITGQNGGAVFVLVYLGFVILLGLPIMLTELTVGRRTQRNPVGAFKALSPEGQWKLLGGLGVLTGFAILSFYSVIAGWTVGYIFKTIIWGIKGSVAPEQLDSIFVNFSKNPWSSIGYLVIFMTITVLVVAGGVKGGIEKWCKILMPVLFGLLVLMIIRAVTLPGADAGISFYLKPDFSKISGEVLLMSLGQAFFSLSLGMGAMVTYGSYLSKKDNLATSALAVCLSDTLIAVMAGMAIFPAVFALGAKPDAGPHLIFIILPNIFSKMPGGEFLGPLFFLLLAIAALTSTVSLLEVVTAYFIDEKGWSRVKAVWIIGGACLLLALLSALSKGIIPALSTLPLLNISFFDVMETAFLSYSLPIGAFFLSIFVGWKWGIKPAVEEIKQGNIHFAERSFLSFLSGTSKKDKTQTSHAKFTNAAIWGILVRFVAPIAIFILIVHSMNIPDNYPKLLFILGIIITAGILIWLSFQIFNKSRARFWKSFLPPIIRFLALIVLAPILVLVPYIGEPLAVLFALLLNYFLVKAIFEIEQGRCTIIFISVSTAEILIGLLLYFYFPWYLL